MSDTLEKEAPATGGFKPKKSVALSGVTAGNTALCTVGKTGNDLHYRGYDILDIALGKTVIRARTESRFVTRLHEPVWVQLDETRTHFFDRKSGLVLNRER